MGVATRFRDGLGNQVEVGAETLVRVCAALGAEVADLRDAPAALRAHQRRGALQQEVQVAWEGSGPMRGFGKKTRDGDEYLRVGAIKIFVDGGFTGPAAYTSKPYKGEDEYRGKLNLSEAARRPRSNEAQLALEA